MNFPARVFAAHIEDRALLHLHAKPFAPRHARPCQLQRKRAFPGAAVAGHERHVIAGDQAFA